MLLIAAVICTKTIVGEATGRAGECDAHICRIAPNGDIYIAGSFAGTVDADPGTGVYNLTSKGDKDIFLARYTANGNFIWAISAGGPGTDVVQNLAVDKNNDPVIVGQITGQNIDFDPSPAFKYLHAKGPVDGFVAKYTAAGSYVWGAAIGGKSPHDNTLSVATDAAANIYIGGDFHEDMDVDPAYPAQYMLHSITGTAYLVKYTASGQFAWGFNFGAGGLAGVDNTIWSINASVPGHVYIAGCFEGTNIDFDPSPSASYNLSAMGIYDAFVAKYTDAGTFEAAAAIRGTRVEQAFDLTLDNSGDIYLTGYTESPELDFDNVIVKAPATGDKSDIFLAKYSSNCQYEWAHIFGGQGTDVGWGVAVNKDKLYCTGYFIDTMDADPSAGVEMLYGRGKNDIYIAKYELNGDFICAFNIGSSGTDVGRKLVFDKSGNLVVSGLFSGKGVDFDPLGSTAVLDAQDMDGFFAKYDWTNTYTPPDGYLTGDTVCSGRQAYLRFTATAGNGPFTIIYSDGQHDYVVQDVTPGQRIPMAESPLVTTVYRLKRIKGSGLCAPYAEPNTPVTILVYPSPLADAGPDTNVCPGSVIPLHGSGAGTYEWYPKEGISNPYIASPMLLVNESTVRHIIVTNGYGCRDTNAVTVEIIPADFKTDPLRNLCIGDTLRLKASGGDTYSWSGENSISNDTAAAPLVWPLYDATYSVLVRDTVCGRSATLKVQVDVHPLPGIKIVEAKDIDCGLKAGTLVATGGVQYSWTPAATLNNARVPNPVATPDENTWYVVTGTDANGCSNKDSALIKVFAGNGRLFTPTAFTPNRDGKNDLFHVIIPGDVSKYELSVFNRFGQMMFHTTDYKAGWDGRFHNTDQPLGTYYYYYKAHSSVCNEVFGKGDVELVR